VRIGLRFAARLREETADRLVAERSIRRFTNLADLSGRVAFRRDELEPLAELGALSELEGAGRRAALWQVAALERDPGSLFAGKPPETARTSRSRAEDPGTAADPGMRAEPSPLQEMTPLQNTLADYRLAGLTTGPQLLDHLRPELERRGIVTTRTLRTLPNGRPVKTAGHVIVRQRPGSGKVCFVTLEDETGTANAILMPDVFRRFRVILQTSAVLEIEGPLQNVDGVIHIRAREIRPLTFDTKLPEGHNFR
jgi:error-prone DNA polymerase